MSLVERDYVLRMIQLLARAIARILGLKQAGKLEEALEEIQTTGDQIFGSIRSTLDAIDPQSAARLLTDGEKIEAYAALTAEEASIRELMGDATRARSAEHRALSLYLEALILEGRISDDGRASVSGLRGKVDERTLPERYQEALASIARLDVTRGAGKQRRDGTERA
jgi:hypothetical protein